MDDTLARSLSAFAVIGLPESLSQLRLELELAQHQQIKGVPL